MRGPELLPGYSQWRGLLASLVDHDGPILVFGETGCGVTTLAQWLAGRRNTALLDDAEQGQAAALETWLAANPKGILAAHAGPGAATLAPAASRCLVFRLPSLEEDPGAMDRCLKVLAEEIGLAGALPPGLGALPCPGNLRGLRNRLVRFKLLGQLPEDPAGGAAGPALPLEAEDLATNLHVLERILLFRALRRSYGNRVEAAQRLGVSRRQLYLLIARHGDPVRGEAPRCDGPQRLRKRRDQNSRIPPAHR